ncbi:MAG: phosphotransferase [Gammaproteobacteria bacterium]|nr:phosphotransferase [Gammaproteobacteria bacterium]
MRQTGQWQSELPDAARSRAVVAGDSGRRWMRDLDEAVPALADRWNLGIGDALPGGSESLVLDVRREDGTDAVLKIRMPGDDDFEGEARAYELSRGRGVASLYARSDDHRALLMERLGPCIADLGWSVADQIDATCRTLRELWRTPVENHSLPTGAWKANWLGDFIVHSWQRLGRPCDRRTRDRALDFAAERADAHTEATTVLVHADAHEQNLLLVRGQDYLPGTPCKFVDPGGLLAEPACDLAVPMRGWSTELRDAPVRRGRGRCAYLAELCAVDERAIWQWGFMERVSTGLHLLEIGIEEEAREMLEIADHWSCHSGPRG